MDCKVHGEGLDSRAKNVRIDDLTIVLVSSKTESDALDVLLWQVLWQPLGLSRDIRRSFGLKGERIELAAAKPEGPFLGGLVANWTSATDVEIRHIAVRPGFQDQVIGSMLVEHLLELLREENCLRIHVIARNTSMSFFRWLGFDVVEGNLPEHPDFEKFGISFALMEKEIKDKCKAKAIVNSPETPSQDSGKGHPKSFHLREFHASDLMQFRQLIHHTIEVCYSGIYPPRAVLFFMEYHSEKEIIKREKVGTILVADCDGTLTATGALVGNEITGVFVAPSSQGQGYGRAIMRELESLAQARGYQEVELSVSLPSKGFYESLGYKILCDCSLDVGEGQQLDFWRAKKTL